MKRVLITGSREHRDKELIWGELDALRASIGDFILIEGGASGADRIGRQWARSCGLPVATVEADWKTYRRRGGHVRNGWMVSLEPHFALAFPIGASQGTRNCIDQLQRARTALRVVES